MYKTGCKLSALFCQNQLMFKFYGSLWGYVHFLKRLAADDHLEIIPEQWMSSGGAAGEPWKSCGGAAEEQQSLLLCQLFSGVHSPNRPDTNEVYHVTVHSVPSVDVLCSYYSLRSLQAEMGSQVSKT